VLAGSGRTATDGGTHAVSLGPLSQTRGFQALGSSKSRPTSATTQAHAARPIPPVTLLGLTAEERALALPDSPGPASDGDDGDGDGDGEPSAAELAAAIMPATNVVPFGTPLRDMSPELLSGLVSN
jgi:hypothetical protein